MATGETDRAGKLKMLHCVIKLNPSEVHVYGCIPALYTSKLETRMKKQFSQQTALYLSGLEDTIMQKVDTVFCSITLRFNDSTLIVHFLPPVLKKPYIYVSLLSRPGDVQP